MAEEAKDRVNSQENPNGNVPKTFVKVYDQIPLKNLRNMLGLEFILVFIAILGVILAIWNFQLITFEGFSSIQTTVSINLPVYRATMTTAYNLSWVLFALFIFLLYLRIVFRKQTSVPLLQKHNLKLNTKDEPIQEKENIFQPLEADASLRNQKVYFAVAIVGCIVVIGYFNYFPRAESLFPSFLITQYPFGFIMKPAEYSTYIWMNIVFSFGILNLYLFLFFFSLRQIKDMRQVIALKTASSNPSDASKSAAENAWKPPLPKPWKYMTIAERKDYQMKAIQLEKEHRTQQEREKFEGFLKNERDKVRLGQDLYNQKQKEKKKIDEITKKEQKKKKTQEKEQEKYDFR